ncbi:MAG: hypothetical protein COB49_00550 [Alphaproteobacteria bacterium]|nr:MAG: hypothetical protein COB49_00550 [Alphaproteobacteria bacterium]
MGQAASTNVDIMNLSDVANATGLNKSTVTRIVKANPDLVQGKQGRSILISKTKFNLVRAQATNMAKSGNHAGRVAGELPLGNDHVPEVVDSQEPAAGSALNGARTRVEIAKADRAEMDLQIRQGQYVRVDDIQKHIFEAFRTIRDELLAQPARTSVELASMSDPKEVKAHRLEENKCLLKRLSEKIKTDMK